MLPMLKLLWRNQWLLLPRLLLLPVIFSRVGTVDEIDNYHDWSEIVKVNADVVITS